MSLPYEMKHGLLAVMPLETFLNQAREDRGAELVALALGERPPPDNSLEWLRVDAAIRRNCLFVLEASSPTTRAQLRFCPENTREGDYELHLHLRHAPERGHPRKVCPVLVEDNRLSAILTCPVKFILFTTANDRGGTQRVWLIGLNQVQVVEDD